MTVFLGTIFSLLLGRLTFPVASAITNSNPIEVSSHGHHLYSNGILTVTVPISQCRKRALKRFAGRAQPDPRTVYPWRDVCRWCKRSRDEEGKVEVEMREHQVASGAKLRSPQAELLHP